MNVGATKKFFTGKVSFSQNLMKGILEADKRTILGIWRSSKLETSDKHPDLEGADYFAKAYERAWGGYKKDSAYFSC